jgi:uncharacterized protein
MKRSDQVRRVIHGTSRLVICAMMATFLVLSSILNAVAQEPAPATTEYWFGKMEAQGRQFRFIIEAKGTEAILISLDEGEVRLPLTEFVSGTEKLSFVLKASQARYIGEYNSDPRNATGTWEQRGAAIPLDFERRDQLPIDAPTETWEGTLDLGIQKLVMRLRVYAAADGQSQYFIDSVSQKVGGFIATAKRTDQKFELEIPALRGKFRGEYSADGESLNGQWNQGLALELNFTKVASPSRIEPPRRPQNPVPPYPYETFEVTFPSANATEQLAGTLTRPTQGEKLPLAILISGSGPQDRDSTLFDHKSFWVLADYLTRRGFAVLRYDERGVGKSQGDHAAATTEDFANDVAAAVRFARSRAEIDPQKIGLIGHSEGGMIAPLVAAADPAIAWIILMAGPGVNGEQILYSQGQLIVAAEGGDAQALAQQRQIQETIFAAINKHSASELNETVIETVTEDLVHELTASGTEFTAAELQNLKMALRVGLQQVNAPWFRHFLRYEPAEALRKVRCPVLALNGSVDLQVDPKLNLPKIEAALAEAGNTQVTIRELPNLNHLFQTCDTGALSRYEKNEETLAPILLETIEQWLQPYR